MGSDRSTRDWEGESLAYRLALVESLASASEEEIREELSEEGLNPDDFALRVQRALLRGLPPSFEVLQGGRDNVSHKLQEERAIPADSSAPEPLEGRAVTMRMSMPPRLPHPEPNWKELAKEEVRKLLRQHPEQSYALGFTEEVVMRFVDSQEISTSEQAQRLCGGVSSLLNLPASSPKERRGWSPRRIRWIMKVAACIAAGFGYEIQVD